jgi:alkylated DNA repair protein alkB homolog 7
MLKPRLPPFARSYSKLTTAPHPALHILPAFLAPSAQQLLLSASLALLAAPARSTSHARKLARQWRKVNPSWLPEQGFMSAEAYEWQEGHFDGVIEGYREMLVRAGMYDGANAELSDVLQQLYGLLPPSPDASSSTPSSPATAADPPSHLLMHLLHLAPHGKIRPHVDNQEAFGRTIVGLSLGGERVMRFRRAQPEGEAAEVPPEGPEEFEVLLRPGDVYVQR